MLYYGCVESGRPAAIVHHGTWHKLVYHLWLTWGIQLSLHTQPLLDQVGIIVHSSGAAESNIDQCNTPVIVDMLVWVGINPWWWRFGESEIIFSVLWIVGELFKWLWVLSTKDDIIVQAESRENSNIRIIVHKVSLISNPYTVKSVQEIVSENYWKMLKQIVY